MRSEIRALIDRINPTCRKALESAAGFCVSRSHYNIEIEHFLAKLIENEQSDIHNILRYYELDPEVILKQLYAALDKLPIGNTAIPALSTHIFHLLEESWIVSSITLEDTRIRSAAILLTLIDNDSLRGLILETCPLLLRISRHAFRQDLYELLQNLPEKQEELSPPKAVMQALDVQNTMNALDNYTRDLTLQASQNKIDPIFGRDEEMRQIIDVLCRRRQNNPLLVGDAGVGKTAIVEGLARRIINEQVPKSLQNIKLLALDLIELQAGASVKGQFEERLKVVLNSIASSPQPVILFIDEAHTLIGAGGASGLGDAANLLKPALAKGELRAIAATTWQEYKRYFEKDMALARRFEVIKVKEPTVSEAINMLRPLTRPLSNHHQVMIVEEAVQAAVHLSKRYITNRQLPDKAIRLLDTAAARVALAQSTPSLALEELEGRKQLLLLEHFQLLENPQTSGEHLQYINQELEQLESTLEKEKIDCQSRQELLNELQETQLKWQTLAPEEKKETASAPVRQHLLELKQLLLSRYGIRGDVDYQAVAQVVADWTGIPLSIVLRSNDEYNADSLLKALRTKVVGQPLALQTIVRQIISYRAGLTDPRKPMGVFLLMGPSGVGKTETAYALAEILTGLTADQGQNLLRFNMTEFQEPHSIATLKGSPPGYVGYGKGGTLTEGVRQNPYSVILLDEMDKAHREVLDLFYQVFDKGSLEDSEGIEVNFANTLILMTANLGAETIIKISEKLHHPENSPQARESWLGLIQALMPELNRHFRSAFLSRVTVVPYLPLTMEETASIVLHKLQAVQERIKTQHGRELTFDEAAVNFFVRRTEQDFIQGARAIDYWINQELLPELANLLLQQADREECLGTPIHLQLTAEGRWAPTLASAA